MANINHLATQIHVNSVTNFSSYFTDKTQCLHYNDQSVAAVVGNNGCLFYETYETTRTVWTERRLEQVTLTTEVQWIKIYLLEFRPCGLVKCCAGEGIEDQLDRSCEKLSITYSRGEKKHPI